MECPYPTDWAVKGRGGFTTGHGMKGGVSGARPCAGCQIHQWSPRDGEDLKQAISTIGVPV